MCPESFGGVTFDIILCMSRFNHVPSWDTLRRDAISSWCWDELTITRVITRCVIFGDNIDLCN